MAKNENSIQIVLNFISSYVMFSLIVNCLRNCLIGFSFESVIIDQKIFTEKRIILYNYSWGTSTTYFFVGMYKVFSIFDAINIFLSLFCLIFLTKQIYT